MGQHLSLDVYLLSMTSMTGMTGMTAEATRENPWSSQIGPTGRLIVLSPRVAKECSFDPAPGIFMTSRMTRWSVAVEECRCRRGQFLRERTEKAAQAGDKALLVVRVGREVLAAAMVKETLEGDRVQISLSPDKSAQTSSTESTKGEVATGWDPPDMIPDPRVPDPTRSEPCSDATADTVGPEFLRSSCVARTSR
jgi:hypothetical protein